MGSEVCGGSVTWLTINSLPTTPAMSLVIRVFEISPEGDPLPPVGFFSDETACPGVVTHEARARARAGVRMWMR